MYKVDLFQYKSQFHYVFNVNPGNQGSPFTFLLPKCQEVTKSKTVFE
jgi:hypothetical protein